MIEATVQQYQAAIARATSRAVHDAPSGDLELDGPVWRGSQVGDCGYLETDADDPLAQLRAAYIRTPRWTPIGVVCPKCGAFWRRPDFGQLSEAELIAAHGADPDALDPYAIPPSKRTARGVSSPSHDRSRPQTRKRSPRAP